MPLTMKNLYSVTSRYLLHCLSTSKYLTLVTSSIYSSLSSHLFHSLSTIGCLTPLPVIQYSISKICTCFPGLTPPIYSWSKGV